MDWLQHPAVSVAAAGGFSGLVAAVRVDYQAFSASKDNLDFLGRAAKYNWKVAVVRWVNGLVTGAVGAVFAYYGLGTL